MGTAESKEAQQGPQAEQEGRCAKCSSVLTAETEVPLWDGRSYCRDCVEAACPGMADYALQHPKLEERVPRRPGRYLLIALATVCCLAAAIFLSVIGPERYTLTRPSSIWAVFIFLLVYLNYRALNPAARKVKVEKGRIRAAHMAQGPFGAKIEECWWHFSSTVDELHVLGRKPGIVICWRTTRAGCGWTPEMRAIWIGFLTLAGVPYSIKRPKSLRKSIWW